jgi:hypothetical protein
MFKHFKSQSMWARPKTSLTLSVPHAMQAIIVHHKRSVHPHLAAIIRDQGEPVHAASFDEESACPTDGEMIPSCKTSPIFACASIIHNIDDACHVRTAAIEILTATTSNPKCLFLEASAFPGDCGRNLSPTHCFVSHDNHSVPSILSLVPQDHACPTSALKHFGPQSIQP